VHHDQHLVLAVDGLRSRSCSTKRSYSAATSANVAPLARRVHRRQHAAADLYDEPDEQPPWTEVSNGLRSQRLWIRTNWLARCARRSAVRPWSLIKPIRARPAIMYDHSASMWQCSSRIPPGFRRMLTSARFRCDRHLANRDLGGPAATQHSVVGGGEGET
jgi:hypothetical protein